jgi:hypothetical protein
VKESVILSVEIFDGPYVDNRMVEFKVNLTYDAKSQSFVFKSTDGTRMVLHERLAILVPPYSGCKQSA